MKLNRLIWGILLLFIGAVLLLNNFGVIEFYWRNVWHFWPIFLIIAGVNMLFNRGDSQVGRVVSIVILVASLSFLFFKGQQKPAGHSWFGHEFKKDLDIDFDGDSVYNNLNFSEPFIAADSLKKTELNISGGGTSFNLDKETDSLISADVKNYFGNFSLQKNITDTATVLNFKMQEKKRKWNLSDGGNDVNLRLNTKPIWNIKMNMGAGEVNFDLSEYKIRTFNFDGGAAALDIKIGDLLPIADVNVKSGVADVKIKIPKTVGCRIKTKTGLSVKDFDDFTKLSEGVYETPNYKTSTKKIFINLDGGLSNFEVNRY